MDIELGRVFSREGETREDSGGRCGPGELHECHDENVRVRVSFRGSAAAGSIDRFTLGLIVDMLTSVRLFCLYYPAAG